MALPRSDFRRGLTQKSKTISVTTRSILARELSTFCMVPHCSCRASRCHLLRARVFVSSFVGVVASQEPSKPASKPCYDPLVIRIAQLGLLLTILTLIARLPCRAQGTTSELPTVPPISEGLIEVGLFPGLVTGLDITRPMAGMTASLQVSKFLAIYGEGSYFPSIDRDQRIGGGLRQSGKPSAYDFHSGVHLLLRKGRSRWVPYGSGGVGYFRFSNGDATLLDDADPAFRGQREFTADGGFTVNAGAGLRFYARERWGLRAEFKIYQNVGLTVNSTVAKFTVGPFFHTRRQR